MRKRLIESALPQPPHESWLALEHLAQVEFTSEDAAHPIESALVPGAGRGWRAAEPGAQTIRLLFDRPQPVSRIRLEFIEAEIERTQEFVLRSLAEGESSFKEILRQQWNFSPSGTTLEVEDYRVELPAVRALELTIIPDLSGGAARAALAAWRLA